MGLHPDIACGWEWTQRANWLRKIRIAEASLAGNFAVLDPHNRQHIERVYSGQERWLGFRRLFRSSNKWILHPRISPPLWLDRFESHLQWFKRRTDIRFVHIVRRDNVEWIKSKELSRITQAYTHQEYPDDLKVSISLAEATARLQSKHYVDEKLSALSASNQYLRVNYEDFKADSSRELHRIMEFLQCDPSLLPVEQGRLKPQSRGDASNYIRNFDALVSQLNEKNLDKSCV